MEQVAWRSLVGEVSPPEPVKKLRAVAPPVTLRLEVTDPEVVAELRHRGEGDEREQFALAALRIGVLALRSAAGQVDAAAIREAGTALVSEVRDLLSRRVTEMSERVASTLTQYLDPQSGALPAAPPLARAARRRARAPLSRPDRRGRLAARAVAGFASGRGQPPLQAPLAHRLRGSSRAALEHGRRGARRSAQGHPARVLARSERLGAVAPRRASSRSTARALR